MSQHAGRTARRGASTGRDGVGAPRRGPDDLEVDHLEVDESADGDPLQHVVRSRRPWGGFEQLTSGEAVTVKVLTVEAGHRLSLQRHRFRQELWQVLDGPLDVTVGDRSWSADEGERVVVPVGAVHRLGNSGDRRGRVLEVAFGHFDESDIERLEDDYPR